VKVVLVSSHPAFPASAGNCSRIQQLARAVLQLGHELTFVLVPLTREPVDDAAHSGLLGPGRYVRLGERSVPQRPPERNWPGKWTLGRLARGLEIAGDRIAQHAPGRWLLRQGVRGDYALQQLLGREAAYYSSLDALFDAGWARQLEEIGRDADAVIVEYVFNSWAFACFPASATRVLDTHDAFADRHRPYLARGISDFWISLRAADENAGFRRADLVLAIQDEEAQRFRRQLAADADASGRGPQVAVVSHLMPQPPVAVDAGVDGKALFVASDNATNRHAVDGLVRDVLPRVVREIPHFDLRVAGSISAHVAASPNITRLGWIDDVHEAYAQAPLSVNPLQVGTGINIKLLEAMAAGVPTVSTATGARGLPESFRAGVVTVPDHDPAAFAAQVVRLARSAEARRAVGRAAFEDARRWNDRQLATLATCLVPRGELARMRASAKPDLPRQPDHCMP
jgi:glycosyltransferase involved in cell wall biosynthesis